MIVILLLISIHILSIIYASAMGIDQAITYSQQGANATKWNQHNLYDAERAIFQLFALCVGLLFGVAGISEGLILFAISTISGVLSFGFWHDGFYYWQRSHIDKPTWNFFHIDYYSNARINLNWQQRLLLNISGLLVLFYGIYLTIR